MEIKLTKQEAEYLTEWLECYKETLLDFIEVLDLMSRERDESPLKSTMSTANTKVEALEEKNKIDSILSKLSGKEV